MNQTNKKGLGRGMEALLSNTSRTAFGGGRTIVNLNCLEIHPNHYQARKHFDQTKLDELAESILHYGLLQPIVVKRVENGYELIAGERRLKASKLAGISFIPAIIKEYNNEESLALGLMENLQRENLNPLEEALGLQRLQDEFQYTQEQVAQKIGKSRSAIANSLRLLSLPLPIQASIADGRISASHGRTIAGLATEKEQLTLWQKMLDNNLNVREAESELKLSKNKNSQPIPKSQFVLDLADKFSQKLATKVSVKGTKSKGSINIHYFCQEDLEKIWNFFN